jgi:hypothetical protein
MATGSRFFTSISCLLLLLISIVALCVGLLWIWEIELDRAHDREWTEKSKQTQPYYWWQFLTHDGHDIGYEHKGPLKLALHPYAVYSNFPNQLSDHFSIDKRGFRSNGQGPQREGKKRVLLVGGSTAFGTGLESDRETVAAQLSRLLDVEVINAAVIGHGSGQELTYLLTELVDLRPDVVLALDGWNDYYKRLELHDPRLLGMNGFDEIESQLVALAGLADPSLTETPHQFAPAFVPTHQPSGKIFQNRALGGMAGSEGKRPRPPSSLPPIIMLTTSPKCRKIGAAFHYSFLVAMQPDVDHSSDYRHVSGNSPSWH